MRPADDAVAARSSPLSLREPPARLFAMICLDIAVSACS
jgi:hypothetical protein